eukprot:9485273-Pyramimonas_sp.AAC.1
MNKGALAGTHLVFSLRLLKRGVEFEPSPDDKALADAITKGHVWWLVNEAMPDTEAVMISEWRNSDNNTSQVKHEIEHIRGLQRICLREMSVSKSVVLSTVVSKALASMQVKVVNTQMLALARYVVDLGAKDLIDELCTFHSAENHKRSRGSGGVGAGSPRRIMWGVGWQARSVRLQMAICQTNYRSPSKVSHTVYDEVNKSIPNKYPLLRLNLMTLAYDSTNALPQIRPTPDVADFVKVGDIKSLGGRDDE